MKVQKPPVGQKVDGPKPIDVKPPPGDVQMKYGGPCMDEDLQIIARYGIIPAPTPQPDDSGQNVKPPPGPSMKYGGPCTDVVMKYGGPCISDAAKKEGCGLKKLVEMRGKEYVTQMLGQTDNLLTVAKGQDAMTKAPMGLRGVDPAAFGTSRAAAAPADPQRSEVLGVLKDMYAKALDLD